MKNEKPEGARSNASLSPTTREEVRSINTRAIKQIDQRQARGNLLLQLNCVLTEDDQDRARQEALEYEF